MDKVRCPACRGAKKVAKLGGIVGECNTCHGSGQINACDKVAIVIPEAMPNVVKEVQDAVCKAIPWKGDKKVEEVKPVAQFEQDVKVDPKKAIYKRKKVSK